MNLYLTLYLGLVLAVSAQRIWELRRSKRNTAALMERGAIEVGAEHYPVMAALHTIWLICCAMEALMVSGAPDTWIVTTGLVLLALGQTLRLSAMASLGPRWTTRIIVLPESDVVDSGIFRYMRHPNYLGVILEIVALPMIFGCWVTAVGFTVANALLLWVRIRTEERALSQEANYYERFSDRNRFLPNRSKA